MSTFTVICSFGMVIANEDGTVQCVVTTTPNDDPLSRELGFITRFDIEDWRHYYRKVQADGSTIHLFDIGFWINRGGDPKRNEYEKCSDEFREARIGILAKNPRNLTKEELDQLPIDGSKTLGPGLKSYYDQRVAGHVRPV